MRVISSRLATVGNLGKLSAARIIASAPVGFGSGITAVGSRWDSFNNTSFQLSPECVGAKNISNGASRRFCEGGRVS